MGSYSRWWTLWSSFTLTWPYLCDETSSKTTVTHRCQKARPHCTQIWDMGSYSRCNHSNLSHTRIHSNHSLTPHSKNSLTHHSNHSRPHHLQQKYKVPFARLARFRGLIKGVGSCFEWFWYHVFKVDCLWCPHDQMTFSTSLKSKTWYVLLKNQLDWWFDCDATGPSCSASGARFSLPLVAVVGAPNCHRTRVVAGRALQLPPHISVLG